MAALLCGYMGCNGNWQHLSRWKRNVSLLLELIEAELEMLLEALPRPYIDTPEGRKRAEQLQRKLAAYFRKIAKSFPMVRTAEIYKSHEQPREAASEIERELMLVYNEWVGGEQQMLHAVLEESIEQSTREGFTGSLGEWVDKYELTPPPAGLDALVPKSILTWTEKHAAKLVKGFDEETSRQLAKVVADGLRDQRGIPGITRDIRAGFEDMSRSRAEMIARTETNTAFSTGSSTAAEAVGSQYKEWIKRSDYECDICGANADEGRIPFDDAFSSGHDFTPGHPRCTCDVAYYGATRTSVGAAITA